MSSKGRSRTIGMVLLGLEPIVSMACGVYAGVVYRNVVSAIRAAGTRPHTELELALNRPR